jgi:hypothetical protein
MEDKHNMKFYLINPKSRTIDTYIVQDENWDYKMIYKILDIEGSTFEWVSLDNQGNGMYIDGEGMLKNAFAGPDDSQTMWYFKIYTSFDYEHTIAGPALVCGTDDEGDTTSTTLSQTLLESVVSWVDDGQYFTPEPPEIYALDENNNIIRRV